MQKLRHILKYSVFSLIPLFTLLLAGEFVCRYKYYRMHDDPRYLVEPIITLGDKRKARHAMDLPEEVAAKLKAEDSGDLVQDASGYEESIEDKAITKMMLVSPCKDGMVYSPCQGIEIPKTYNEYCWRGPSFNAEKPKGIYRIIAVGGSTVEGHYIGDEDLWTVQLQRLLNQSEELRGRFEVLNAGHHDFYSSMIRKLLEEKAFLFDPDMIFYYEAINEQQVSHPLTKIYGNIVRLEKSIIGFFHNALFFKSFLYTYLLEKYHFVKHGKQYRWFFHEEKTKEDFAAIIDACYRRGIEFVYVKQVIDYPLERDGKDLTDQQTIRTLLAELYAKQSLDPKIWAQIHALNQRLTNILLSDICHEKGVTVIDPLPVFNQARNGPDKLFRDICHKTCMGEKLLAECIYDGLRRIMR